MNICSKTVGILGGMGPFATAAFFQSLLKLTPAEKDWNHLRIIIDNNPHIPSRTRHLLLDEASPFEGMLETCQKLERYPVDVIAIPCNSAAIFVPQLQESLQIPVLNIIEITVNALSKKYPLVGRVAVIGGYVTYKLQSYKPFLKANGLEIVDHGPKLQGQVEQLIEKLKLGQAGSDHAALAIDLIAQLKQEYEAEAVILACTEFGCISGGSSQIPVIDSSLELARYTVEIALT